MPEASLNRSRTSAGTTSVLVVIFAVLYLVSIFAPIQRRLWFDELYTYYIAHAPTVAALIQQTQKLDLAPPLMHLAVRFSEQWFGPGIFAIRLPSVLAYFAGSLLLHVSLAKRIGKVWAAVAVLAFWSGEFFLYATEIRPYGLLLFFFALGVWSLDGLRSGKHRIPFALGLALSIAGMLLSHMFGIFSIGPICASELVRSVRRRKVDLLVWAALLLPFCVSAVYIPILQRFSAPETFPSSAGYFRKVAVFFGKSAIALAIPMALSLGVIFWFRRSQMPMLPEEDARGRFVPEDLALMGTLLLPPVLINLVFLKTHSAFFDRYCITSGFALCVLCTLVLWWLGRSARAAWACVVIFAGALLYANVAAPAIQRMNARVYPKTVEEVMPELPVVVVSGITFLEADRDADEAFVKRLFYVTDAEGYAKYAHASSFESMGDLRKTFPIRANIEKFSEFRKTHRKFLLLATPQHPEAWFLHKMMAEENVRKLGDFGSIYRDNTLFEVIMRD